MRSSPAWQIPRAGEAIPACPRQILLCSCLSRATRRRQAAYRVLDLREKGATRLSRERLHGDAGDGLQATAAGTSSCHPGASSPKYRSSLGRSSDGEAVLESQRRDFGRAPPARLGGGCCSRVRRAGSHQSSTVLPLPKPAPLRGRQGESEHPRVLPCLLPAVCPPRCRCCQALPAWVLWLPKPERCHVLKDAGPLLPALSSVFLSCFFN